MALVDKLSQTRFGSYILREKLGEGGFAVVYKAEHMNGGAPVAVKVMRDEFSKDTKKIKDFHREFSILSDLDHKSIPQAKEMAEVQGLPAFSMSVCPGETFYALRKKNVRFDIVGAWLAMIRIMAAVHDEHTVHNDLKLENMLLGDKGHVSLLDFGSARSVSGTGWFSKVMKSKSKVLTGTLTYLAPELLDGKEASKLSDVYSLGISAHILFSGKSPIEVGSGVDGAKSLYKTLNSSGIKRIAARVDIPKDLGAIIDSCVRLDPEGRPEDAADLWHRVDNYFKRPNAEKISDISRKLLPKKSKV